MRAIARIEWATPTRDLRLQPRALERERARPLAEVRLEAAQQENEARAEGWNDVVAAQAARAT